MPAGVSRVQSDEGGERAFGDTTERDLRAQPPMEVSLSRISHAGLSQSYLPCRSAREERFSNIKMCFAGHFSQPTHFQERRRSGTSLISAHATRFVSSSTLSESLSTSRRRRRTYGGKGRDVSS